MAFFILEISNMILDRKNITIKSRKRVYDGFFKIDEIIVDHDCIDGGVLTGIRREVIVKSDTVSILIYDPDLDAILFVRQLRVPLLDAIERENPWTVEIIAGTIDRDESPEAIAVAEAHEEAGIMLQKLIPIYRYYPSTGSGSGKMHLYLGLADLTNAGGYYGLAEEGEDIEAFVVSRTEAFAMMERGEVDNGFSLVALLWFQLHYPKYQKNV